MAPFVTVSPVFNGDVLPVDVEAIRDMSTCPIGDTRIWARMKTPRLQGEGFGCNESILESTFNCL